MTANAELQRVNEWGWLRGFANLLRKENRGWWSTRRAWINALLWTGMLGGVTGFMLYALPSMAEATGDLNVAAAGGALPFALEMGRTFFFEVGTMALSIGIIILCQDLVVDEKQTGVTEWILAKPVARRSYILAKLGAALVAILALLIILPAAASYSLLSLRMGELYPPMPFLAGLGIMTLHSLFYLTLTLMLGTLFTSRAPILGIAFGSLLGGNLLASLVKPLVYLMPWMLPKVAGLVAAGQPIPNGLLWSPSFATLLWSLVFTLVALARFERTEF